MIGADRYYDLFQGKSEQIGRLFFYCRYHARGKTFNIYLLPEGVKAKSVSRCYKDDVVCVYGVIGGQLGWTEKYGWIHKGAWQKKCVDIFIDRRKQREDRRKAYEKSRQKENIKKKKYINELLSDYQ